MFSFWSIREDKAFKLTPKPLERAIAFSFFLAFLPMLGVSNQWMLINGCSCLKRPALGRRSKK
jgi:hypothetical protein